MLDFKHTTERTQAQIDALVAMADHYLDRSRELWQAGRTGNSELIRELSNDQMWAATRLLKAAREQTEDGK